MFNTLYDLLGILGIVVGGIFVWAAISPIETLGWWAGWFGDKIYESPVPSDGLVRIAHQNPDAYILFLSGVGRTSTTTMSFREKSFLEALARSVPNAVIIDDVFPYSVNNMALTEQPIFARFWKRALKWKMRGPHFAGNLINLRNIFQMLVSVDKRYGPMFNQGVAEALLHGLIRYNYDPKAGVPILLVASSGAAQIAVGVCTYLREYIEGPLAVVSLGGVFASDPGLLAADKTYHLYGKRDLITPLSNLDAGRWPIMTSSFWNRARRQGRVTEICLGDVCHTGRGSYLDFKTKLPDGTRHVDKTVEIVKDVVNEFAQNRPLPLMEST